MARWRSGKGDVKMGDWGLLVIIAFAIAFVLAMLSRLPSGNMDVEILKKELDEKTKIINAQKKLTASQDELIAAQREYIEELKKIIISMAKEEVNK